MENTDKKPKIQSVSRAADILRCFHDEQLLGLTDISRMTGLHKSTAAGLVSTLCAEGLLMQDPQSGKYSVGLEIFRLAKNVNTDINDICHPYLLELLGMVEETVNLAMLDGDGIVYVDKIDSPHSMRICSRIGQRLPFYCTANGKALVSLLPESEQDEIIENISTNTYTANTITDKALLKNALLECRSQGFACDNEEYERGLICYAMPIINPHGKTTLSISVSSPIGRMNDAYRDHILDSLRIISNKLSSAIAAL